MTDPVRQGLWPHLGEAAPPVHTHRARAELIAELKRLVKPA